MTIAQDWAPDREAGLNELAPLLLLRIRANVICWRDATCNIGGTTYPSINDYQPEPCDPGPGFA